MAKINWSHLPCFLRLGVLRMLSLGPLFFNLRADTVFPRFGPVVILLSGQILEHAHF